MLRQSLKARLLQEAAHRKNLGENYSICTHSDGKRLFPRDETTDVSNLFRFSKVNDDTIKWEFKTDAPEMGSVSGKTLVLETKNVCKTRHEVVAEYITGDFGTDNNWSVMDSSLVDTTTPDLITRIDVKTWAVIEIGTTKGSTVKAYAEKFRKYMITLTRIAELHPDWKVFFWIIIVSPREVYSTFDLNSVTVDELIFRFKLGVAMEDVLIEHGLMDNSPDDLSEEERAIKGSVYRLADAIMEGKDQVLNEFSVSGFQDFEPDNDYVRGSFKFMLSQVSETNLSMDECKVRLGKAFSKLDQTIVNEGGTRTDKKSPVQMPLFVAGKSGTEDVLKSMHVMPTNSMPPNIDHVWRRAYESKLQNHDHFVRMSIEEELELALTTGLSEMPDDMKSKWHRVNVDLESYAEAFAMDGLNGKKYKQESFKEQRREFQTSSFSYDAPIDDLGKCIEIKPNQCTEQNVYYDSIRPLIGKANKLIGNDEKGEECMRVLFNSDIVIALSQMSAVASELAVSLRQHVSRDGWILKKIKAYDIELLIKPTNSESHVFYLMRMKGSPIEQGTFRRLHYHEGWWYTDLLSVNSSRLENMIRAPVTYVLALLHFRINVDKVDKDELEYNTSTGYSEKMAMLTLLISLEDKATTEELALNVRYIAMQFAKGPDYLSPPDPSLAVLKSPTILRSRLAVFLYARIKQYCLLQMQLLPVKIKKSVSEEDHSSDLFDGLLCPFTHHPLRSFYDIVQVMYIPYSKNKDSAAEQNSDFGMIKKIAEYGMNTSDDRMPYYKGEKDPPVDEYPKPHEFSPSFLAEGCDMLIRRFKNDLGSNWQSTMEYAILKELIRMTHHETLATMKASANFDASDARLMMQLEEKETTNFSSLNSHQSHIARQLLQVYREAGGREASKEQWAELHNLITMSDLKNTTGFGKGRFKRLVKSCKCHEAVIQELKNDPSEVPLLIGDYTSIFRSVMESMGGVCCYLFKKNQHGGLREIYVLTFKSRLLQLLPEVTARVLCQACPEEVLTHPDKKISGYESHHSNVLAAGGTGMSSEVIHRTSSEDKSKWCQGMNVAAFSFMISRLLSFKWASAVTRVFHAFRNKKVLLPEGVVRMLTSDTLLQDSTYKKMRTIFRDQDEKETFETIKGHLLLRTPTGMWQGILHYTSSLLHVVQTLHYKSVCKLYFKQASLIEEKKTGAPLGRLVLDTVVSSDDSATYGTVLLPQGFSSKSALVADKLLDMLLKLETIHSRFFMMLESAKSCISSKTVGEFNSIFSCSRTYISPAIKKVMAAATIPQNEDLEGRQMVMANMFKDMLEEGCTHLQVHLSEIACSFLHYSGFGLTTSSLFEHWAGMITEHPDPHLGFLILDQQDMAGVFGYDCKKYLSLEKTNVPLMPSSPAILQMGMEGEFNAGVVLTQGDRRRWVQFVEKVATPGWEEYLEENPHVLYMDKGVTREQINARLSSKACSKGIHESLKQDGSMVRIISSTVYLLSRNVITVKRLDLSTDGNVKELAMSTEKRSLMHLTMHQASDVKELLNHSTMTDEQRNMFYPNHHLHVAVSQSAKTGRGLDMLKTVMYRKIKNVIEVRGSTNTLVLPILPLLRLKWVGQKTRVSKTVVEYSWRHYTNVFPWLKPTMKETLESGPFTSHIRMYNFFQGVDKKSSRLNVLSRKIRSFGPFDQVMELINHNQYPEMRRISRKDQHISKEVATRIGGLLSSKATVLGSVISSIIHGPYRGNITATLSDLFSDLEISDEELIMMSKTRALSKLAVIYAASVGLEPQMIARLLQNSGQGVVKSYIMAQKLENGKWVGAGRLLISTRSLTVEVLVDGPHVIAIKSKNLTDLKNEYDMISKYLLDDGFDWDPPKRIVEYKKKFPEIMTNNITEWTCCSQGLIKMPSTGRMKQGKRGVLQLSDPESVLNQNFSIVIQSSDLEVANLTDEVFIEKHEERSGSFSLRALTNQGDRQLCLMKSYGPRSPRNSDIVSDYLPDEFDEESLSSCWVYGKPLDVKVAYKLLAYRAGLESHVECEVSDEIMLGGFGPDAEEDISFFIGESFRWRVLARHKVDTGVYSYVADLGKIEGEIPVFTKTMQEQVRDTAEWFMDKMDEEMKGEVETEEGKPDHFVNVSTWEEDLGEEALLKMDTTSEVVVDEERAESLDTIDDTPTNTSPMEMDDTDLKPVSGLLMSHPLWDNIIDVFERHKIWTLIREKIPPPAHLLLPYEIAARNLGFIIPAEEVFNLD